MSKPKFYTVKNWEKYQHYHDAEKTGRIMPWIKLYSALHDDLGFYELSDIAKLMWPHILILASKTSNRIPNNGKWVSARIGVNVDCPLNEYVTSGFLIPHLVNPSREILDKNPTDKIRGEENREDEIRIDICAEPEKPALAPKIDFNFSKSEFTGITEQEIIRWRSAYPAVDIDRNILAAGQWLTANPAKRKKNNLRFLVNWFARQQERGGDKPSVGKATPTSSIPAAVRPGSAEDSIQKFGERMRKGRINGLPGI